MWYENQVSGLGEDFILEFENLLKYVSEHPMGFRIAFSKFRQGMMKRFPYVIAFEIKDDLILVSTLTHAKQHPQKRIRKRS